MAERSWTDASDLGLGNNIEDGAEVSAQTSLFMCLFLHLVVVAGTAAYPKAESSQ